MGDGSQDLRILASLSMMFVYGKTASFNFTLPDKNSVRVALATEESVRPQYRIPVISSPLEGYLTRDSTRCLTRAVATWVASCPAGRVAAMLAISEITARLNKMGLINTEPPPPVIHNLDMLFVVDKSSRNGNRLQTRRPRRPGRRAPEETVR